MSSGFITNDRDERNPDEPPIGVTSGTNPDAVLPEPQKVIDEQMKVRLYLVWVLLPRPWHDRCQDKV